jgi:hypothetical protein
VNAIRFTSANQPESHPRRLAIRSFARAVAGAAVMSVAFPWQAHAQSACGGWSGGNGCRPCNRCQRQTNDCVCFDCRSCGPDCPSWGDC